MIKMYDLSLYLIIKKLLVAKQYFCFIEISIKQSFLCYIIIIFLKHNLWEIINVKWFTLHSK